MSVNAETLRLAAAARAAVDRRVDGVTNGLAAAWVQGWDSVVSEWQVLFSDIERRVAAGEAVSTWRLARLEQASQALTATAKILDDLGVQVARDASAQVRDLLEDTQNYEAQMVGSQLPADAGRQATVGANLLRVDPLQIQAIALRTTEQITSLTWPLTDDAVAAIQSELVRGVAVGDNPRHAAARMLQRVEGRFNGGLARAMNIARTEMLDAHREAARQFRMANTDVLQGWKWLATFDTRTCPSCLSKHGTEYPPETPGPLDHQQGRCTSVPVTKDWSQLGFKNVTQPPDTFPSSSDWYDGLPDADKLAIMGKSRAEMLAGGQINWSDLSTERSTAGWRDSFAPTSLADLRTLDRAASAPSGSAYRAATYSSVEDFDLVELAGYGDPEAIGDPMLGEIYRRQGFDGKPEVLDGEAFDAWLTANPDATQMYRGLTGNAYITGPEMTEQFRSGDEHFPGLGIYGNGSYFSDQRDRALNSYALGDERSVLYAALRPDAKVLDYTPDLHESIVKEAKGKAEAARAAAQKDLFSKVTTMDPDEFARRLDEANRSVAPVDDLGRIMAMRGYDAIRVHINDRETYLVILNRTAVVTRAAS